MQMALFSFASCNPFILSKIHKPLPLSIKFSKFAFTPLSPITPTYTYLNFTSFHLRSSAAGGIPDPVSGDDPGRGDADKHFKSPPKIADEWDEESEPEPKASIRRDQWEEGGAEGENIDGGNGSPATAINVGSQRLHDRLEELKRALVDTVYGTDFGFQASAEVRAELSELVAQLEAANPTPAPVEERGLNGNWILLYTASSELLPLLAAGITPLLKVDEISQTIDTSSSTVVNSTTLSSPFAYLSFSASATFEVRSPARIQVVFKEAAVQPPEIKSRIELLENVNIFGQNLNLSLVQRYISPLQHVVEGISHAISGQPPLRIPIPGERTSSWLITTYLDDDLRISRGDSGLFILAREGSSLLD